jgi:hypothetical protein
MKIVKRRTTWAAVTAVAALGLLAVCGDEDSDYWEETSHRDAAATSTCAPNLQSGKVAALYVYNCDGKWQIRATAGGGNASYAGVITSDKPMKVKAYRLERHDLLDASNPRKIRFEHTLYSSYLDGFDLELPDGATATLTLQKGALLLVGKEARKVTPPFVLEAGAGAPPGGTEPPPAPTPPPGTPPTASTGTRKWFPGQYSKTEGGSGPGFTGWRVNVNWSMLEPKEGQYDFSQIEGSLKRAQAQGKKVIIFIQILTYGGQYGTAPAWAAQQGATYAGKDSQGRTFGVLKVYEPWVTSKLIAIWEKLRQRFDSHPSLALVTVSESTILPQPKPGLTPEKLRDQWYRWCDHFKTWAQTPRTLTMTYGAAKYKEQMSRYAVDRRIGVRAPDMRSIKNNCVKVPETCHWSHAWQDYKGEAIYHIMCSAPSSGCLPSPQATYNEAVQTGIHFLVWVDSPKNWSASAQKAFVQSKAHLPACGMNAKRPSMWP